MSSINQKNTSKALFKNTGIIAIGRISTKLVNFLLLPLYTSLLSKEEYGTIDLLSTYTALIVVVVGLQMSEALFRFLVTNRNDEERIKSIFSTVLFTTLGISLVYTAIFLVAYPFLNIPGKWYLLARVIIVLLYQIFLNATRGIGHNADYAFGSFLSAAVTIVLNVIAIAVLHLGIEAMLLAYVIGPLVSCVFFVFKGKLYRYISFKHASTQERKTIFQYCIPLVPNELSWSVIHSSDRIVISNIISIAANGIIAAASKFSAIYTTVFSIFNTSWTEQVVLHYKDEGGKEYINDMFEKMVTFFASIAIGIIAVMPFVFNIFIDTKFNEGYGLVPFYLSAVFFNAIIGMISSIYLINNETKQVAISTMVAAAINLVIDLMLVKVIGIYAAPISSLCGYATISFWRLYDVNKRHCKISMKKRKVLILLVMLAACFSTYYIDSTIAHMISLVFVAGMAMYLNKSFISETVRLIVKKK